MQVRNNKTGIIYELSKGEWEDCVRKGISRRYTVISDDFEDISVTIPIEIDEFTRGFNFDKYDKFKKPELIKMAKDRGVRYAKINKAKIIELLIEDDRK